MTIQEFINISGFTQASLAKAVGVSPSLVTLWVNGKREIQPIHAKRLEKASVGCLKAAELCPAYAELFE